jgi:phosphate transport system protein
MTVHFDRELQSLKQELLLMGAMAEKATNNAFSALMNRDTDLAASVIAGDEEIDRKELQIGEECLKVLALNQPLAGDLRFMVSVMMVNNDLERVGDLAVNIAERAIQLAGGEAMVIPTELEGMVASVREMVKDSLDSLVNRDTRLARDVCRRDDEVDDAHGRMFRLVTDLIKADPDRSDLIIQLLSVSRNLERIADHATNIAEDVVFMYDGEVIKHPEMGTERRP